MTSFFRREACAFLVISAGLVIACQPRTPEQAEAAYTTQILACVDKAGSVAASRACRAEVDRKWGKPPFHGATP